MINLLAVSFLGGLFGRVVVPIVFLLILGAIAVALRVAASRYKKIAPNTVGIFYGRKRKRKFTDDKGAAKEEAVGFRVVSGGGSLLLPFVEQFESMPTAAFQTTIDEKAIPNKDNVKINVKGVATCKISTDETSLYSAAKAFLGKSPEQINVFVQNILLGHLRSIIGTMNIDEILRERDRFNQRVIGESTGELKRLGVEVITLVIQDVNDGYGYIDALGKRVVAEAIRDADIKTAEAQAESTKKVSDANREASITVAANAVKVAEAEKDRDVKKAQYKVTADTELAKANQALAIATAEREEVLRVAQAHRDAAEKEAQIAVAEKEAERRQAELNATIVKTAEAQKEQTIINAEAEKRKTIIDAEASKEQQVLEAEAAKQKQILAAEAEQAAQTKIGEGEGAKAKAIGDGQAAATKATMMAQAEGAAAQKGLVLKAEAEGTLALANALKELSEQGKLILILDRLPALIEKGGDAFAKVAKEIFTGVAAPLGNIDNFNITDFGGTGRGLDVVSSLVPNIIAKTFAALQATGVDVTEVLGKCGVDISSLKELIGKASAEVKSEKVTTIPAAPADEHGKKKS